MVHIAKRNAQYVSLFKNTGYKSVQDPEAVSAGRNKKGRGKA